MEDNTLTAEDVETMLDQLLDETGPVHVAGLTFYPSDILKNCDPIAYRCTVADYEDMLAKDGYTIA